MPFCNHAVIGTENGRREGGAAHYAGSPGAEKQKEQVDIRDELAE